MKRGELQRLLKVPCTVKQARQIKRRNKQLLAAFKAADAMIERSLQDE